jgi:CubicO group peptidase (beta-lactamase class C family)
MLIGRIVTIVAIVGLCLIGALARSASSMSIQGVEGGPAPEFVLSDSQRQSPAGATFTVPAGWSITRAKNLILLTPPEPDTHVAIFDTQAADAKAAVAEAWTVYKPLSKRPIKLITPRPARDGWDERQDFDYETSPNERAVVVSIAHRAGTAWTVFILDGSEASVDKRDASIDLISESLRPNGYQRESFAGRKAHPLDKERVQQLKDFVRGSMKLLDVPGIAMALLDNGKVVYEGGFGLRELGKPDTVDEGTLFMAASNTKGMTTLLLSELVDEGKLRWDEPVIEAYPQFKLGNLDTTEKVLIRNLICACTGMPRQDYEWLFQFKNATPDTVFKMLATMQPTSKFGEVFQYSNLMASAAGYIGAHIVYPNMDLGSAYDRAMQEKVFDPLGMKSTTFDFPRALAANHASPHGDDVDGKPTVADMGYNYTIILARPAAGVWTSAHDFIRYVQLELNRGKLPDGRQLVSQDNLLMRRKSQVSLGETATYGMGLIVDHKYGIPVVSHGGSLGGFKSNFFLLPESGVGAVILTNSNSGRFVEEAFRRRLLEVLFDGKREAVADIAAAAANYQASQAKDRERLTVPADPAMVTKLARRYSSKELGELDVLRTSGATTFSFRKWKSLVASRKNDDGTISFVTIDPTNEVLEFEFLMGEYAGKRILTLRDAQHEYVFNEAE